MSKVRFQLLLFQGGDGKVSVRKVDVARANLRTKLRRWRRFRRKNQFLGAFSTLLKATISSVVFIRPHGITRLLLWNLIFEFLRNSVEKIQFPLHFGKNNGYFTWRPVYIFDNTSFNFFEWEMFQTKVVEKIKTHFLCSITLENRAVYEMMWKNVVESDRPQMTIWCMQIACWIPISKSTNTQSEYVILIAIQCNNGYTNAPRCYVTRTLPLLLVYEEPCTQVYLLKWWLFVQRAAQNTSTHSADRTYFSNVKSDGT